MSEKRVVYITQHEVNDNNDVVMVNADPRTAKVAFDCYIDELEKAFREIDGEVTKENTFNRFSEPTQDFIFSANMTRQGDNHYIYVKGFPVD
jgi:hypothetical protein